jgi:hypothetical protein
LFCSENDVSIHARPVPKENHNFLVGDTVERIVHTVHIGRAGGSNDFSPGLILKDIVVLGPVMCRVMVNV